MNRETRIGIAWAGAMIALALAATFARKLGLIDADTTTRIVIAANGLVIAWYGNRMPKAFAPSAAARRVARIGGWSMVLSGLVYTGLWAFAPLPLATALGCAAIVAGILVTVGYCVSQRASAHVA